jgi:hypothetical protein
MLGTKTADKNYSFKHLAAALYFNVVDIPTTVTQFKVTAIGGEKINGEYTVDISGTTPTLSLADNNGSSSYTIKFPAFTEKTSAHFVVPIPVGTYTQGFKVELLDANNTSVATSKLAKNIEIARADLGVYPTITVDATEIDGTIEDPTAQAAALQSLKEAFVNGGEYTFTNNISLAEVALTLPADKSLTLDLNGKTLQVDATSANCIKVAGNLTIKDTQGTGKIEDITGADSSIFWIGDPDATEHATSEHAASLTVESGTISATKNAFIVRDKSTLTIKDGSITTGAAAIYAYDNSTVSVENGTITSSAQPIYAVSGPKVNISGGTISGTYLYILNSTLAISGGSVTGSAAGAAVLGGSSIEVSGDAKIVSPKICIDAQEVSSKNPTVTISGGTITSGGGASQSSNYANYGVKMNSSKGSFTMTNGTVSSNGYGVALIGYENATISGGELSGAAFAFSGLGTRSASTVKYNFLGGTFTSTKGYAIYLPNLTETTISGNTIVDSKCGIAIQRGELTIKDNVKVTANAESLAAIPVKGDGSFGLQYAALSASSRYGDTTVKIEGGTFKATDKATIFSVTYNGKANTNGKTSISITGGSFTEDPSAVTYNTYTFDSNGDIATTTEHTDNYVAEGYTSTNNGSTWTVAQSR